MCWESKPVRYELNKPQAATVVTFVIFAFFFLCDLISCLMGRGTMTIPKIILSVHGFLNHTVTFCRRLKLFQ